MHNKIKTSRHYYNHRIKLEVSRQATEVHFNWLMKRRWAQNLCNYLYRKWLKLRFSVHHLGSRLTACCSFWVTVHIYIYTQHKLPSTILLAFWRVTIDFCGIQNFKFFYHSYLDDDVLLLMNTLWNHRAHQVATQEVTTAAHMPAKNKNGCLPSPDVLKVVLDLSSGEFGHVLVGELQQKED